MIATVATAVLDAPVLRMRARRTQQRRPVTPVVRTHRPARGAPVHH
ncbi:hypothetical protein OG496_03460 [Streptomyces sp. NBC_00988]|nr:hypothetical protein OG496_03460 [Streptomyces sp. NBC_00988]